MSNTEGISLIMKSIPEPNRLSCHYTLVNISFTTGFYDKNISVISSVIAHSS